MVSNHSESAPNTPHAGRFSTTHWSVVLAAGDTTSPASRPALEELCRIYWYPLYAFARRRGHQHDDAEDLTQGFLSYLLQKNLVGKAREDLGRFRSFLLACFQHFLDHQFQHDHARIRGGDTQQISLDTEGAERRFALELSTTDTPETLFERKWALTVLRQAMDGLETEYRRQGKTELFDSLHPFLKDPDDSARQRGLAERLQMTEGALRVALFRLRQRYRELLRSVVAQTVGDLNEIDAEIQHLIQVLSRSQ
jgi:DNA-directed RNA polymerase specialized sigma24 family protein